MMEFLDKHVETELVLVLFFNAGADGVLYLSVCVCLCVECVLVVPWDARLYC